ncbi:sterol desaturase family protein [Litorivivens sp.]|uniref:sterol desaturase family protein n=1 Tax=Litorivivens sp. TaxID=2020868 RepID=UPI00356A0A7D
MVSVENGVVSKEQLLGLFLVGMFMTSYLVELGRGRIQRSRQPWRDAVFSGVGVLAQIGLSGPLLGGLVGVLAAALFPTSAGGWAHWPFWLAFFGFILLEDFLHYWLHRYAHEWRWLWRLHRTHHSGTAMNVGLVFRYNVFWTLMLPQAWFAALMVYMGLHEVYFAVTAVTFTVNVLTHMSSRWDLWLWQKVPGVWGLVCRVITTPDTHHAHHGMGRGANPRGNYAVVFFLWDTLFGTGKIPRARQLRIGLPHSGRLHWAEELFWPLVRKPLAPKR